jgi:L-threonylcarbamoyladenylate synthase
MVRTRTLRIAESAGQALSPASHAGILEAAAVLRAGGTVAFPTETVYGLGANAMDSQAVEKIFLAKQRPTWDPLIVHIADAGMLARVAASVSARAQRLIDAFWPGPLTLLLPKTDSIPDRVTAGRPLVGVRMSAHPVAMALIAAAGVPVAAPSANRFGHTSPTTAQHVLDDLEGRIDLVLDGGPTIVGVESTVIEVTDASIILYRAGGVPAAAIEAVAGPVEPYSPAWRPTLSPEALPSPGVGIRHYAPRARLIAVEVEAEMDGWLQALQVVERQVAESSRPGGVLLPSGWPLPRGFSGAQYDWGSWRDGRQLAQRLFAGLRALDAQGVAWILCPLPSPEGLGAAIRDRLIKAAREI